METKHGDILLYESAGLPAIEVRLDQETVWLSQKQMALLFDTERSVITKHLRNIFNSGELEEKSNVQKMHIPPSDKPVSLYNLEVTISVGYRVNSRRGTQFRQWATRVLREHLVRGYTVNEKRLAELKQTVRLIETVLDRHDISGDEATALLRVVADFTRALDLLDDYDHHRVAPAKGKKARAVAISYDEAVVAIVTLKKKFSASTHFGMEKDQSLRSSLATVFQTFDGKDVYPTLEAKAAHLLYFLVKNHSFVDGNKRIAAALLLWFLERNHALCRADGANRLTDAALVAITLMIAESDPREKEILCRIVEHLLE